jgi:hypothetical protein
MSSEYTGFWVAEVYEPYFMTREPDPVKYTVMTDQQLKVNNIQVTQHRGKIFVGTVAITGSKHSTDNGMAEENGSKPEVPVDVLVDEALRFWKVQ